jgi:hypothetical protein
MLYPVRLAAAFCLMPFLLNPVHATTLDGQFATRGLGAVECQALPAVLDDPANNGTRDQFVAWITGYMSYASRASADTFDVMPIQDNYSVGALAELLCRDNPLLLVETVVFEIIKSFENGAVNGVSDVVNIGLDGSTVVLRAETMQRVQDRLVEAGLLPAADADGIFGPKTRVALETFQKSAEIQQTGLPDALTLFFIFKPS